MADIGHYSLLLAFLVSWYTVYAAFRGAKKNTRDYIESSYRGVWALFGLFTLASIALIWLLAVRDLNVEYVARYTSKRLPMAYAIPAFWAGNGGSLLLWVWILTGFSSLLVWRHRRTDSRLVPYSVGVLMLITAFFTSLIVLLYRVDPEMTTSMVHDPFYALMQAILGISGGGLHPMTNPFWRLSFTPADGMGLNPQLQNPAMLIHPPMLYLGYVGMAIPFAFAMAALISRQTGNRWLILTRRWNLIAWLFLSLGNILGAWWAYVTLGWGGYWGWDPVENAAFLPWLVSTAFVHSAIIQEKRGMLKVWNMVLIVATFALTIFGTYLTRSGVISSVHAFARNEAFNVLFLAFFAAIIAASLYLIITRLDLLKSESRLDSLFSREAAFIYSNVVFVGVAFVVLFGTMYPLISELFTGVKSTVGPPWFNAVLWPLWAVLLLLIGIGPVIAWRRAGVNNIRRNFMQPVGFAILAIILMVTLGVRDGFAVGFLGVLAFVLATIVQEFYRGTRAQMRVVRDRYLEQYLPGDDSERKPAEALVAAGALKHLMSQQTRRYGAYIVHLGVVLIAIGITASGVYQQDQDITLRRGQKGDASGFSVVYRDFRTYHEVNREVTSVTLELWQDGEYWRSIDIVKEFYQAEKIRWTKPTILSSAWRDVYVTLSAFDETGTFITVNVKVNPLVPWMWIGGLVLVLGTLIALWPPSRQRIASSETRAPGAVVRA
jgi:cytochrome c-type biogenesis protein CcmF